jgi:hypothetical protein
MEKLSGPEELRLCVKNMNATNESFNTQFTAEQLLQIHRMLLASGWDILPDEWTDRQVEEALNGKPPKWDKNECPIYDCEKDG